MSQQQAIDTPIEKKEVKYTDIAQYYHEDILNILPEFIKTDYSHIANLCILLLEPKSYARITDFSNKSIRSIYYDKIQHNDTKKFYFLKICRRQEYKLYIPEKKMFDFFKEHPHPNVLCPIYYDSNISLGDNNYNVYLYEYYSYDLFEAVKHNFLPESIYNHIISQIISFLKHIHSHNICHGDLKLENIMLCDVDRGTIKVIDFESCLQLDNNEYKQIIGCRITPGYITPEYMLESKISLKTDIWTLGCIMYELITGGYIPFARDNQNRVWVNSKRDPILKQRNLIQSEYELILKLLSYDYKLRPNIQNIIIH